MAPLRLPGAGTDGEGKHGRAGSLPHGVAGMHAGVLQRHLLRRIGRQGGKHTQHS